MNKSGWVILAAMALSLSACKTLDTMLDTADSAIRIAKSGTVQGIQRIAESDDPEAALKQTADELGDYYAGNPEAAVADIRRAKRELEDLMAFLSRLVGEEWGRDEVRVPTKTQYVKYTQNYQSRAVVDFDAGTVTVETLDEKATDASLKSAIVTTLLTPEDPRAVDLFSDKPIELTSAQDPYLKNLVLDHNGRVIDSPAEAEAFADYLVSRHKQRRDLDVDGETKVATFVQVAMVSNFESRQAEKYRSLVERYAKTYGISPSLVYAVIRTESNFNPYAVSHVPAYGLMQLVPTSGGRDAYRHVSGRNEAPSKEYLFDAGNNIQLGTAYLQLLNTEYLDMIQNDVSREYCMISAYNTGAGNVLKAFSHDRVDAINAINSRSPAAVYEKLRADLPYEETRAYLARVVGFRKQFVSLEE
ncbi:MAG TPA: murein transglycosylase domain-containing protein [Gammaproteobacteria bacterium]